MKGVIFLCLFAAASVCLVAADYKVVCYYASYSVYRAGKGQFATSNINPYLCTHLIYAFINVDSNGLVKINDPWNDVTNNGFKNFVALKSTHRCLKVMVAIGGGASNSTQFSQIASSTANINAFVNSVYNFTTTYKFDGLDLDWEFPAQLGGVPADRVNYITLLKALRTKYGTGFVLSAAVGSTYDYIPTSYDVVGMSSQLDFISVMDYDMHTYYDSLTGPNAPLYGSNKDITVYQKFLNVNNSITSWLSAGAPASKLILGIPFYAQTYTLQNSSNTGYGAPSTGPGLAGAYTQSAGALSYMEVLELLPTYTKVFDTQTQVPYAYKGANWMSYDDVQSVTAKVNYAKTKNLAGAMVWTIDFDNFTSNAYPLLRTIVNTFYA